MTSSVAASLARLSLAQDGAQRFPAAVDQATLQSLINALSGQPADYAGVRLFGITALRPFVEVGGPLWTIAASVMEGSPRPVRAILFDKNPASNWSLGWHQDRVIAVKERIEIEGYGPWTRKHGAFHVAPPVEVLEGMTTMRLHLDPVPADNAPLLIAVGSHRLGRIPTSEVRAMVDRCGVVACLADAGDVWLYSTPVLHASDAATHAGHRRVLQVDYAVGDLPGGLEWLGV